MPDGNNDRLAIRFATGAFPDDDLVLEGAWGKEKISRLYAFDLVVRRNSGGPYTDDEIDALLKAPCSFAFGPGDGEVVHGLVERIDVLDSPRERPRYVVRVVPNVWLLTLTRSSRLYQDTTIPDLVRAVLASYGMQENKHFVMRVNRTAKSPKREYVVQYEESDWDFIQRWLEHEGFFYWFAHEAEGEKLYIADENDDATPIEAPTRISYRGKNNLATDAATVWDFRETRKRIPAKVALFDYNYRAPSVAMMVTQDVDAQNGFGSVFYYGEHFKNADVGKEMAKLRAELAASDRRVFFGQSDCARFRVGHTFELEDHYEASNDRKYLITQIEHRVGYVQAEGTKAPERLEAYTATFEAIPLDTPYRPDRVTPWPKISGFMHAHVEADGAGDYASIDADGRYKVRMPYDTAGKKGAKASRWIRMAQAYAGPGYGQHHPLHKGIEVLIGHVDGNPDRPIIVGAVPNPRTVSPSTNSNATQSVTQTASGIRVEMEDLQS
ncbi:MAG TPA: type VI secretion system tip protein TssI/VgrG [Minicystis sp.]|nr:type VI secretion system tip protein TssI/VgrG [Minicystis sp.]